MGRMANNGLKVFSATRLAMASATETPSAAFPDDDEFDLHDDVLWDEIGDAERDLRFGDHAERPTADEWAVLSNSLSISEAPFLQG